MDTFYIFRHCPQPKNKHNYTLIVFCSGLEIDTSVLKENLKEFFERNRPPERILFLGGSYMNKQLAEIVEDNSEVLEVVPGFLVEKKEVQGISFGETGILKYLDGKDFETSSQLLKDGIFNIFKSREGLVRATSDNYHFIFPSGKHSPFFIRPGNILIHSAEIQFIAVALLQHLDSKITTIYCDTSSINSLAFALAELKKRFDEEWKCPSIISFGSYDQFESFDFRNSKRCLVIISASTSGRLVEKLRRRHPNIQPDRILSLFYLSKDTTTSKIICDLTYGEESFPQGIEVNEMSDGDLYCQFCNVGSYPVKITGDIFLLEKPKVHSITIRKQDRPGWLNGFVRKFYSRSNVHLIRCFYGEDATRRFEIFFKSDDVMNNLDTLKSDSFFEKEFIKRYKKRLAQVVPASTQRVVYLADAASRDLAHEIKDQLNLPSDPISINKLLTEPEGEVNDEGAILVVCSCLITGNSLLYINKYLRRFKNMSKTFFVIFSRTESDAAFDFVRSNIIQGENQFIEVEKLSCPLTIEDPTGAKILSWSLEMKLLNELKTLAESGDNAGALPYLIDRIRILKEATDQENGGLINAVFLKNPITSKSLELNNSFAFLDFEEYRGNISQADVYFIIAVIINQLRFTPTPGKGLIQEEHIRTVLNPSNFDRFNDGIIQASILRSATANELNYKLDRGLSLKMMTLLVKMVENSHDDIISEALVEFMLALSIGKLKVYDLHLKEIINRVNERVESPVIKLFAGYLRKNVLSKPPAVKFGDEPKMEVA